MSDEREVARAARRRDPEEARALIADMYPKAAQRRLAIELFAEAIEKADALNESIWGTTLRSDRVHLNVGKVVACGLYYGKVWLSLSLAALAPEDLAALGDAGIVASEEFKLLPGSAVFMFPVGALEAFAARVRPALLAFIEAASRTAKYYGQQDVYSSGVLRFLESELGRTLPRPAYAPPDEGIDSPPRAPVAKAVAVIQPRVQFTERRYDVDGLLNYIENGDIALPDIQRPFVWKATRVRDLFDSMYRGFPVGSLMLWSTMDAAQTKSIGVEQKQRSASLLVVDGQQRLTSLYAVLRGKPVLDDGFQAIKLEIAFRPRDGSFDVTDAAIRKDPEYIPNISELWTSRKPSRRIVNEFIDNLRAKRDLSNEDEDAISHNLDRLFDLTKYPFTTLEIAKDVDEEAVADIFVRINNGGAKLGQSDFILTLLSVFSPETRRALEDFARDATTQPVGRTPSPYNHLIQPAPDQLVRVAIAVGFHRARLSAVYQLLRGKDPDTGAYSADRREEQFRKLEEATPRVLDVTEWHLFINTLIGAGFRSSELISSANALLNAYALRLIGKLQCQVDEKTLGRVIGRFFFAVSLSGYYSGSSETAMEEDLARVRDLRDPAAFVGALEDIIASIATNDFWEISVPRQLETSSVNSPAARAYLAAQIKLGAPVLFSDRYISSLYDPMLATTRKNIEGHHLFPRAWLKSHGIIDPKQINQAANLAHVEWPDNAAVSDSAPSEYVPKLREQFSPPAWDAMSALHALPSGWENMGYDEFLRDRRKLMARIIRRGFEALAGRETLVEAPKFAAADETRAWSLIEELELTLRQTIRKAYETRFGLDADTRMARQFTADEMAAIERNRARHLAAYPLSPDRQSSELLDYLYLGQLVQLLISDDVWPDFKPILKDKEHVHQTIGPISRVRNDRAHFRAVPEKELQRCVLAADDLLTILRPVGVGPSVPASSVGSGSSA